MSKKTGIVVIIAIVLIIVAILGGSYNSLVTSEEKVNKEFSNVSVMLERRADLIPNLVNTVKGYATHEQSVIDSVTKARENLLNSKTIDEKETANNQLTSALNALMVVVENYPDLRSSQNFIQLSDELAGTENRIATARRDYNDAVNSYNSKIKKFPSNIMAKIFGFEAKEYFEAEPSKTEVPKVEF